MNKFILTAIATLLSANAFAYEINGSSDDGFVLKCKDGTTNTSTMPPNHNTASAFCEDHGGIAAGYPKKIIGKAQAARTMASPSTANTATAAGDGDDLILRKRPGRAVKAQDYNASRSNKPSR